jgi:ribosomal protein L40E
MSWTNMNQKMNPKICVRCKCSLPYNTEIIQCEKCFKEAYYYKNIKYEEL